VITFFFFFPLSFDLPRHACARKLTIDGRSLETNQMVHGGYGGRRAEGFWKVHGGVRCVKKDGEKSLTATPIL
jgi:hypothetical protein